MLLLFTKVPAAKSHVACLILGISSELQASLLNWAWCNTIHVTLMFTIGVMGLRHFVSFTNLSAGLGEVQDESPSIQILFSDFPQQTTAASRAPL